MRSLALIGATGLFVPRHPIADIFMMVQSKNGGDYRDFRHTLFRDADAPEALAMFPDGRMPVERELLRYRMFRFASRVGFAPPYLHDRKLRDRLHRFAGPAVVIAGERDNLVPRRPRAGLCSGSAQGGAEACRRRREQRRGGKAERSSRGGAVVRQSSGRTVAVA